MSNLREDMIFIWEMEIKLKGIPCFVIYLLIKYFGLIVCHCQPASNRLYRYCGESRVKQVLLQRCSLCCCVTFFEDVNADAIIEQKKSKYPQN